MSSADVFLSFEGRLDRERWLGGAALLAGIAVAAHLVTWALARDGSIAPDTRDGVRAFAGVALLAPWLALDWKRFQDHGWPGLLSLACPALAALARIWTWPGIAAHVSTHAALGEAIAWAQLALAALLVYVLALRPGVIGPNAYGPDPRPAPVTQAG